MSTALAIAGVTAVLRDMLEDWLDEQGASAALDGANIDVTAVAPDTIPRTGPEATPKLNLFLHQVSPNQGWVNEGLPSRDADGERTSAPALALDLHYLLTAYAVADFHAEVLLGYGMQLLHEAPVLGRQQIQDRLPAALDSRLARQLELIKITPVPMSTDELSKLWSALQSPYRPTAAYRVSVAVIDSPASGRHAQPVLTRGPRDPVTQRERGVVAQPDLTPGPPGITAVRPPNQQPGATLGQTVLVDGYHLDGTNRSVRVENRQLGIDREIVALPGNEPSRLRVTIPSQPTQFAVGTYALRALVQRPGETARRESNQLSLAILPEITTALPLAVARDGAGDATVTLTCDPQILPFQRVSLVIGGREVRADDHPTPTSSLTFLAQNAPVGSHLLRLRVDGIESLIVDRTATPPVFLNRRVVVT